MLAFDSSPITILFLFLPFYLLHVYHYIFLNNKYAMVYFNLTVATKNLEAFSI